MNIYDRITLQLEKIEKTRKDLAEATNIPYNTLTSQFQRESDNMSIKNIIKIANFLNVTTGYLITGKNENLLFNEDRTVLYNSDDELSLVHELNRVYNNLSLRDKTILLAYAYDLENKDDTK